MSGFSPRQVPALYRNELEKLWARRSLAILIAFVVLVFGGVWTTYHNQKAYQHAMQNQIPMIKSQIVQVRQQLSHTSGKQQSLLQQQLKFLESDLKNAKQQGANPGVNEVQQVKELKAQLPAIPPAERGSTLEQLAMARYRVAHGLKTYDPNTHSGFRLVGRVFGGMAILLFALLALGLSGDRVSSELEGRTWGSLLLHAPRRRQVYLSKLLASLTIMWGFMVAATVGFFGLGSLVLGVGSPMSPHVVGMKLNLVYNGPYPSNNIPVQIFHIIPQWSYDLAALGLGMLAIGAMIAIFIALSMISRSTVITFIIGAVLVLSSVMARALGGLSVADPAAHLSLVGDWTGQLVQQNGLDAFSLHNGLVVVLAWAAAAIGFGLWYAQRLDV